MGNNAVIVIKVCLNLEKKKYFEKIKTQELKFLLFFKIHLI